MKNRNVPYGYTYIEGELVLHSQESVIVSEIFQQYLAGKSLLKIAEELNVSVRTVESKISKSLEFLRKHLSGFYDLILLFIINLMR